MQVIVGYNRPERYWIGEALEQAQTLLHTVCKQLGTLLHSGVPKKHALDCTPSLPPTCSSQFMGDWVGKWRGRTAEHEVGWRLGDNALRSLCVCPGPTQQACLACLPLRHAFLRPSCRYGVLIPRHTARYVPPPAPSPPKHSSRLPPLGWKLVASDSAGRVLAAAGEDSHSVAGFTIDRVSTSQDAARTWTASINASLLDSCVACSSDWRSLRWSGTISGDGSLFLAGTTDEYLYASNNGRNWTRRAASYGPLGWDATAASYDGMRLAAVAGFTDLAIYTSTDGVRKASSSSGAHPSPNMVLAKFGSHS